MRQERGNALFLILIAVALFAALSYAVTQSGRSGGGVDKEQKIISAALMVEQATAVQQAVVRMMLTGTTIATLDLGIPSPPAANLSFESLPCTTGEDCVFAPEGGGAIWPSLPVGEASIRWEIIGQGSGVSVKDVGTTEEDILLDIYDLSQAICEQINKGLGLSVPVIQEANGDFILETYPGEHFFCYEYPVAWGTGYDYVHVLYPQ